MALVAIQVELPQYSHTFSVQVPPTASVGDIKREIAQACPGHPNVDGQRLIWKGRVLSDAEVVEQLWKSPDEPRIVHLAVNPWAWPGSPPEMTNANMNAPAQGPAVVGDVLGAAFGAIPALPDLPQIPQITPADQITPLYDNTRIVDNVSIRTRITSRNNTSDSHTTRGRSPPVPYIVYLHNNAIRALQGEAFLAPLSQSDAEAKRLEAFSALNSIRVSWPEIFDKEYPPETDDQGAKYETVNLQGYPYLRLANPDATPTPRQLHAVKVLSHTFPVLSIPVPLNTNPFIGFPAELRHAAALGAGLGLGVNVGVPPPHRGFRLPVGELIAPFVLLGLRTLFLLYFFSPTRKPFIVIILGLWVIYEGWAAVQRAFRGLNEMHRNPLDPRQAIRVAQNGGAGLRGQPGGPAGNANVPGGMGNARGRQRPLADRSTSDLILIVLALMNLDFENDVLNRPERPGTDTRSPSFFQKVKLFISLLFLTLHPAVWDKRRAALKSREGQLKTERTARETAPSPGEESPESQRVAEARVTALRRHAQRPPWVQEYVARVGRGEWDEE